MSTLSFIEVNLLLNNLPKYIYLKERLTSYKLMGSFPPSNISDNKKKLFMKQASCNEGTKIHADRIVYFESTYRSITYNNINTDLIYYIRYMFRSVSL
jgi:hypothetical protein